VIELDRSRKGIVLRVTDNGVGLPKKLKKMRGLGFHIMNYRARSIGGRLKVESRKKGGTCVTCCLPKVRLGLRQLSRGAEIEKRNC